MNWARQQGAQIQRFNLAQQPMEFSNNQVVRGFLEHSGQEALPLPLVDGEVALAGPYPHRAELAHRGLHYTTPMMQLQDRKQTKLLIATFAETTLVVEAANLQADLRRAGIEPWAGIISARIAAATATARTLAGGGGRIAGCIGSGMNNNFRK